MTMTVDNFSWSSTPAGQEPSVLANLQFPLRVMPVVDNTQGARVFISGGKGEATVNLWDVNGGKVRGKHLKGLRGQFATAFKQLTVSQATIEAYITYDVQDNVWKAVCIDLHDSSTHAKSSYIATYEERLRALAAFLSKCSVNKKNQIYGPHIIQYYDWNELWPDLFGDENAMMSHFPYVSLRSQGSIYKVGEDDQWMVVDGEWLFSQKQMLIDLQDR